MATITVENVKYPFVINFRVFRRFREECGIELYDLLNSFEQNKVQFSYLVTLAYLGIESGFMRDKKTVPADLRDEIDSWNVSAFGQVSQALLDEFQSIEQQQKKTL